MFRRFWFCLLLCTFVPDAMAQMVRGRVEDAQTGEPLELVKVNYVNNPRLVVVTDSLGRFSIPLRKGDLLFTSVGYDSKIIRPRNRTKLQVKLQWGTREMDEVEIVASKTKYSRKNNPAVELIRHVIESKRHTSLSAQPFYSLRKYEKMVMSLDHISEKMLEDSSLKRLPYLKDQIERHPETGELILPLTIQESVSRQMYRRDPHAEQTVVEASRSEGLTDVFNTGDIVTGMLSDVFQDVDILSDEVRLFQHPFLSPICSGERAIRFYRYFIQDTVSVDADTCYRVHFTPNNPQDFGFSGTLYIMADSTWRVRRAQLNVPLRSDVNFVDKLNIDQEYAVLPTGEQMLVSSNMRVHLKLTSWIQRLMVQRTTYFSDFSFRPLPDALFAEKGNTATRPVPHRSEEYWQQQRPIALTPKEQQMGNMVQRMVNAKGSKPVLWLARAFIENYVETSVDPENPSKFDIGPVNSMVGSNFVEGVRLRLGGQTTANLNSHWFLKGYAKYGFKDREWKGLAQLTYSFNAKKYMPHEWPMRTLTAGWQRDVSSPSDKFLNTDADNVFVAMKWTPVRHMNYFERYRLGFDWETENGWHFSAQLQRERQRGAGETFYQPLTNGVQDVQGRWAPTREGGRLPHVTFTEATVGIEFQPGATYINTKQRRRLTNYDSPSLSLSHTVGVKGVLGGEYDYNFTEAGIYKRFWFGSWGKIDCTLKAGAQWNRVPYLFLCMPQANLSYIVQDRTFSLLDNMEFLNDRYASLMVSWDMNGKLFNRVPLLNRLKWRELIGFNMLYGTLTDKNNPYLQQNRGRTDLFFFPGQFSADGTFAFQSHVMSPRKPYVELVVGVHNIFKFFRLEYVRRLNYTDHSRQRWGIRGCFEMSF